MLSIVINFLKNPTFLALSLVIAIFAGLYGTYRYQQSIIDELNIDNGVLIENNATLKQDLIGLTELNANNLRELARLENDARISKRIIDQLNDDARNNKITIAELIDVIDGAEAAEDGPIAPVLRKTIEAIQANSRGNL